MKPTYAYQEAFRAALLCHCRECLARRGPVRKRVLRPGERQRLQRKAWQARIEYYRGHPEFYADIFG